ncbi:MAG TPA: alpha/beta fold hydrolase [Acidobacteriaceae bacterium]|jgi:pimeloyl-ACP methyl ester carboxylesterase|nr:alpha/beta fold hydrolase [Acidobacteriaceae bacterium]
MATVSAPLQKQRRMARRIFAWFLMIFLPLLAALIVFALARPLDLLIAAVQVRLLVAGIRSDYLEIPYGNVGQVRIHYYVGGSGSPVVLVHGLGGRAEDWVNLMTQLVRDHHRVYALDLPGYGRSDWPQNAQYSVPELAGAVESFMDQQHLARTDLGGWSMGGWLAMRVALDQPQRIRRLMIFDSAGVTWDMRWNTSLFEPDTPEKLQKLDELLMPTPPPHVPGFVQRAIFRYVAKHGWVVRRNMDSMLTRRDLLDGELGALRMPMLIVWGKQDYVIPASVGDEIHQQVPQSELEIFDGCGHLGPEMCASRIGPVMRGFLDEPAPAAGRRAEIPQ